MTLLTVERDDYSAPFYDAASEGRLLFRRCLTCLHASAPSSSRCARCFSDDVVWEEASRAGVLVTWTSPYARDTSGQTVPQYVVGIAELAEGFWLHGRIRASDSNDLSPGVKLMVEFEAVDGGEHLPVFVL